MRHLDLGARYNGRQFPFLQMSLKGTRNSDNEFNHFLGIALGSLAELETQLIIAEKLGHVETDKVQSVLKKCEDIGKMLRGLKKAVKGKRQASSD